MFGQIEGGELCYGYSLPKDTVVSITGHGIGVQIVPYAQSSIESTIETQLESIQSTIGELQSDIGELQSDVAENKYNYVPDWSTAAAISTFSTPYSLTATRPTLFIFPDNAINNTISSIKVNSNTCYSAGLGTGSFL